MVKTASNLDAAIWRFIEALQTKIEVVGAWRWLGAGDEGYGENSLFVVPPEFDEMDAWQRGKLLAETNVESQSSLVIWGFKPAQLSGEDYSPLLGMMMQDARQVYPAPPKPARKAKAGHVN